METQRKKLGVFPVFKKIATCAAEFKSETPYMYSTYQNLTFCQVLLVRIY